MEKKPMETMTLRSIGHLELTSPRCCIPLKVACFILGYLTLLVNLFNTLMIGISFMAFAFFSALTQSFLRNETGNSEPVQEAEEVDQVERAESYVLLGIGTMLLLNLAWLGWNLYIIIGLHKRQPGPIILHMIMASLRFVLLVLALGACIALSDDKDLIFLSSIEIGATGCYLIAYHAYATRLKHGLNARILAIETASPTATDVYFAYPKNMDKQNLVENEKY